LETAATGNETLGHDVFFPGRKHPISRAADKRTDTHREERHRREIKGAIRDADEGRSKQQIQRETRTAPRYNVRGSEYIVNRDCSDD
jgi:hypothetical protein